MAARALIAPKVADVQSEASSYPPKVKIDGASGVSIQEYLAAEAGLESAARLGLSHWYVDMSLPQNEPNTWDRTRADALLCRAYDAEVRPIVHGNGLSVLGHEIRELRDASAAYVKREVLLAAELGAPLILHGGPYYGSRRYDRGLGEDFDRFIVAMAAIAEFSRANGVDIWIENLAHYRRPPFGTICSTPEEMSAAMAIPGVQAVVDIGHANIDNGSTEEMVSLLRGAIACLSLSDNDGAADAHLPPGSGTIQFQSLFELLRKIEWRGIINIEVHHGDPRDVIDFLGRTLG